jgi:hypothetical protein
MDNMVDMVIIASIVPPLVRKSFFYVRPPPLGSKSFFTALSTNAPSSAAASFEKEMSKDFLGRRYRHSP